MKIKTKEFLTKLAELFEEYDVEMEVEMSSSGWGGYDFDQIDVMVPYVDGSYKMHDYVKIPTRYVGAGSIRQVLEKNK
jgi:hypothetical protein